MQSLRRVGIGIWVCTLLALLFITWSVGLARSVKGTKARISERAGIIRLAMALEEAVRGLEAGIWALEPDAGAPAGTWSNLMRDYRSRHNGVPWAQAGLEVFATRMDSLVQRIDGLHAELWSTPGVEPTPQQGHELRLLVNAAAAQSEGAVRELRAQLTVLSQEINAKWSQLSALVAVSGLLSLTVVGLMLGLSRAAWKQASMRAALQGHQERLRLVLDQLPAILWTTDRNLRLTSSMGRGLALHAKTLLPFARTIADKLPRLGIVVACGLGPDTVHLAEPLVREIPGLSLDAQSKLRKSANAKDPIDWPLAETYLRKGLNLLASG